MMSSTTTTADMRAASRAPLPVMMLISAMFLFSGASGLMYEVVWSRQLTTFFGSTLFGVATVLSAFMGGLALGSWLLGRRADRMTRPLVAYGWFEIGIGCAALMFPVLLKLAHPVLGAFYATGGEQEFYTFSLVRFVITFALLMVPTTLMGATLPIMSRAVTGSLATVGHNVGGLYALNTLGAVAGTFLTGFFLLEHLGVFRTTLVAFAINVLVGLLAVWLGRTHCVVEAVSPDKPEMLSQSSEERLSPGMIRFVLFTYFLSGMIALSWQVSWTRALIFGFATLKSTTYSFSGMLVVFLMGLALGSAIMQAVVDRQKNLLRLYALIQAGIGLTGALSFFIILANLPMLKELTDDRMLIWRNAVLNVVLRTAAAIGLPTFLMGLAFPVVARLVVRSLEGVGGDVARVYAVNTLGAIFGSFLTGFVLIPLIGITKTMAVLASMNMLLAAALFLANSAEAVTTRRVSAGVAAMAAVLVLFRIGGPDVTLQQLQENEKFVFYEEGALATVSVIESDAGDRTIYVDDVGVAGTDKVLLTDQKSLAHVPMLLLGGRAERTLSVGFGSGGASYSYTLYPQVDEIHTIEIAPEVIRAAPSLLASNYGVIVPDKMVEDALASGLGKIEGTRNPVSEFTHTPLRGYRSFDPRFRVLIDDARSYLRFTDIAYDVIATDCTDLRYKSNANLYDLEYFELCRERLSERGLVVVWMPLAGLSDLAFRSALRTFQVVFPKMSVWYFTNYPTHYCLLIGSRNDMVIDYEAMKNVMALDGVAEDLKEIGLADADKLIASFVCDDRSLTEILADYPLNTEDRPLLEFEAPRHGYNPSPVFDNMNPLYEKKNSVLTLVRNAPEPAKQRIAAMQDANPGIFLGHHEYRMHNWLGAYEQYAAAKLKTPDDNSLDDLLKFEEMERNIASGWEVPNLNTLWLVHALAHIRIRQGEFSQAVTMAAHFTRFVPEPASADSEAVALGSALNMTLAEAYIKAGNASRGREFYDRSASYRQPRENWDAFVERVKP